MSQKPDKEYIIIPKEIIEDIKVCLRVGCDGTLPNEGELMRAIERYSRPVPPPDEKVMLCFGNYWECPIDEEDCKVSDACHQKAIRDREHDADIAARAREDALKLLEEWDYHNNRNFGKPHPVFSDMIRLVREKPDEVRKHIESLRSTEAHK